MQPTEQVFSRNMNDKMLEKANHGDESRGIESVKNTPIKNTSKFDSLQQWSV